MTGRMDGHRVRPGAATTTTAAAQGDNRRRQKTKKFLAWEPKATNRNLSPTTERRLDTAKFKTKSDLLACAAAHPGALTTSFLRQCVGKTSGGRVSLSKQLAMMSAVAWQERHTNLKGLRDQKEVLTLCTHNGSLQRGPPRRGHGHNGPANSSNSSGEISGRLLGKRRASWN